MVTLRLRVADSDGKAEDVALPLELSDAVNVAEGDEDIEAEAELDTVVVPSGESEAVAVPDSLELA